MEIVYKTNSLKKACTDSYFATRQYGEEMAAKIQQRIQEIESSDTVEMMMKYRIGRCHQLHNDRKGQYAVDLVHPYRLVFIKEKDKISIIRIIEIADYH